MNYENRLIIPLIGRKYNFYTKSKELIAIEYNKIIIGKRGPYIEFLKDFLIWNNLYIPENEKYRINSNNCYYIEWRTKCDYIKIYEQLKIVDYADYQIGKFYISPFDLYNDNNKVIIEKLNNKKIHNFKELI